MKSGATQEDLERRLLEAQRIRDDAENLPAPWHFLLGADLNIPDAAQSAYQELVGSQPGNAGRFFDPIKTPGNWNNNPAFRFVHTQDPANAAGMDDRFDQILLESSLIDAAGFEYIGNPDAPYSTTTWNDPNHSYRAWGNDGTSFNTTLTINGNAMVGATIAQALVTAADGQGHIPAFLDLRVPAEVDSPTVIDFGTVTQNSVAQQPVTVTNAGNVALWTAAGIANLNYTLAASSGFTAPAGPFVEPPGGTGNTHTLAMDTGTPGTKSGTLTIASDAPDEPVRVVTLTGEVVAACYADCNADGLLDISDFGCFTNRFISGDPWADCNADGLLDISDFGCFSNQFIAGCP
jgi:hypothetical protein